MSASLYDLISGIDVSVLGVVSSPSTTLEISLDIQKQSEGNRALGQMVFVQLEENERKVLSLGQIVEIETRNRWHEDPSFKGVIKHYGKLPHLSGVADNRMAKISVQSSFDVTEQKPNIYSLGMSPSTGIPVATVDNKLMDLLVKYHGNAISYLGKVYGTDVDLPMWFKHFGQDENIPVLGAKDAYHIGVFGKTGSGKSVTAALMLLAYAKNSKHMNILILDPQGQFHNDRDLLPDNNENLHVNVSNTGMEVRKYKLIDDVSLPGTNIELLGELLEGSGFIREAFGPFYTDDKIERTRESIISYFEGRMNNPSFNISKANPGELLSGLVGRFLEKNQGDYSDYIKNIYAREPQQGRLYESIKKIQNALNTNSQKNYFDQWHKIINMFSLSRKITIPDLCEKITGSARGNFIILDLSPSAGEIENENLQAWFLRLIEEEIVKSGGILYANGKKANCLIVMDEAHRFISSNSPDVRVKELTRKIVDAVRTTRKHGIGHMFITQSLESLDDKIISQMRIFAFGHGLTMGSELRKVKEIINNQAAVNLYASFIDPSNSGQFPFMFFGPVSPFSATGSPLFVEIYTKFQDFNRRNKLTPSDAGGVR